MPILVPKGGTRVGEVAGQFIMRNKKLALERAIAQQQAALQAQRIRAQQEAAATDAQLRREEMERRSEESALDRDFRKGESSEDRALRRALAGEDVAARKEEGSLNRQQRKDMFELGEQSRHKRFMEGEISAQRRFGEAQQEADRRHKEEQDKADKLFNKQQEAADKRALTALKSQWATQEVHVSGAKTPDEVFAAVQKQLPKIKERKKKQALQDKLNEQKKIYEQRRELDKQAYQEDKHIRDQKRREENNRLVARTVGEGVVRGQITSPEGAQKAADVMRQQLDPGSASNAALSKALSTPMTTMQKIEKAAPESPAVELTDEDYKMAETYRDLLSYELPTGLNTIGNFLSSWSTHAKDYLDPFGQGGSAQLLADRQKIADERGRKRGYSEDDLNRLRDRFGRVNMPTNWTVPRYE